MENKNHLGKEKSPYLLQHKDNPVWWYPWSEEAFERAWRENKPIFLSVGYATCHWCHVMEGDSFERDDVAEVLNKNFISIKVDREERPDVDSIYMTAVQAMTGRGGWPMSVIMTPDLKPFYGGTFIARDQFIQLLTKVSGMWNSSERDQLVASGTELTKHLIKVSNPPKSISAELGNDIFRSFYNSMKQSFDPIYGGFGVAPKFPSAMGIMMLARIAKRTDDSESLRFLKVSLDRMARGGIYDQIGGGFHRYSTDKEWIVPHFEKMLYDNALLLSAYLEAFQLTGNEEYRFIAEDILLYASRDLISEAGGFYAAEDADSEKAEGKFYVWQDDELKSVLSKDEYSLAKATYGFTADGNFDTGEFSQIERDAGLKGIHHANIPTINRDSALPRYIEDALIAPDANQEEHQKTADKGAETTQIGAIRNKLFAHRSKRIRPLLDTKILTSWNGLMIYSIAKASRVFSSQEHLNTAAKAAAFILETLWVPEQAGGPKTLFRRYADGESAKRANLEDFAYLIMGLIELFQSSQDIQWLDQAISLQDTQDRLFWDKKQGAYFDTDGVDKTLLVRTKTFYDSATPSGNSVAALNLLKLHDLTYKKKYLETAEEILKYSADTLLAHPTGYPMMMQALDYYLDSSKQVAVVSLTASRQSQEEKEGRGVHSIPSQEGAPAPKTREHYKEHYKELNTEFLPNMVLAVAQISAKSSALSEDTPETETQQKINSIQLLKGKVPIQGKTTIYVCEENICKLPSNDLNKVIKLIRSSKAYKVMGSSKIKAENKSK